MNQTDEINDIEDNDCWALTQMINDAENYCDGLLKTISMLNAYQTVSLDSYSKEENINGD